MFPSTSSYPPDLCAKFRSYGVFVTFATLFTDRRTRRFIVIYFTTTIIIIGLFIFLLFVSFLSIIRCLTKYKITDNRNRHVSTRDFRRLSKMII